MIAYVYLRYSFVVGCQLYLCWLWISSCSSFGRAQQEPASRPLGRS